jgi:hypothetical protein
MIPGHLWSMLISIYFALEPAYVHHIVQIFRYNQALNLTAVQIIIYILTTHD